MTCWYRRVRRSTVRCVLLGIALLVAPVVQAAAPTADYLFPGGGCRGQTVTVAVGGKLGDGPLQVDVEGTGLHVTPGENPTELVVEIDAEATPGRRWIRLYNAEGATQALPFLVSTTPELIEAEPNDAPSQAQPVESSPCIVNGQLGKGGDVDTLAVELRQGETFVAALEAHRLLGSPMDTVLQILSSGGFVLAQNDDERGLDPGLVFDVPEDGRYLVRMFGFPATPNQSISFSGSPSYVYRLTLTTGPFIDRARPLAVRRGESTPVELEGWNLTDDVRSQIITPEAEREQVALFHPAATSMLLVPVVDHPILVAPPANGEAAPPLVDVPSTITGNIVAADQEDVFQFQGQKDETLVLRVEARQLGYTLDPVLRLADAEGKVLKELDDAGGGRDVEFVHKLPADGEYRVAVRDLHGHASPRGMYRLTVARATPEFQLSVAAQSYVLKAGEPLEIEINVARLHGFAAPIEIAALGLPDDITATAATSPPEGDEAKKVKIKLESAASTPWSGAMQIVGHNAESPDEQIAATAALKADGATTERIWLSRLAAPPASKKP